MFVETENGLGSEVLGMVTGFFSLMEHISSRFGDKSSAVIAFRRDRKSRN